MASNTPPSSIHISTLMPQKTEPPCYPRNSKKSISAQISAAHKAGIGSVHITHGSGPSPWNKYAGMWKQPQDYAGMSSHLAARDQVRGGSTWSSGDMTPHHFFGQVCWPHSEGLKPFHGITMTDEGRRHYEGTHFGSSGLDGSPKKPTSQPMPGENAEAQPAAIDVSDVAPADHTATSLPIGHCDVTPFGRPSSRKHTPAPKHQEMPLAEGRRQSQNTQAFLGGDQARAALYGS